MKSKAKRRDHIVSVDLGGQSTKAVVLDRKGDKICLQDYAVVEAPVSENGGLTPDQLGEHLKEVVRVVGGKNKQLTVAIGVDGTIFRQLEMPLMPMDDLRRMLKFNSKNYLQQDLPDYVFDGCFVVRAPAGNGEGVKVPGAGQKQKVAVGGVKRQMLENLQEAIKVAGLIPDQVVPAMVGPINAFEIAEPEVFAKEVVALVDIGYHHTTISILDTGDVILNRVITFGGKKLTEGLAESLAISVEEAENIKVGMTSEIQENLEMIVNPLGRELRASIDFFEHQHDKAVTQVFVSGSTASNEIILQNLQRELIVPCKSWNTTQNLEINLVSEKLAELEQVAPKLAVAVGAAASGF